MMYGGLGLEFRSAGLHTRFGLPAARESAAYCRAAGTSLANHRSQPLAADILPRVVWVIGMARSHAAIFRSRFAHIFGGGIGILGAPGMDIRGVTHPPEVLEVPDPYGGTRDTYQEVCNLIWELLAGWEPVFREVAAGKESES
jgi:protein-tyrosine-phosphatase